MCVFLCGLLICLSDTAPRSNVAVDGGEYTCKAAENGGFLFAAKASRVNITDVLAANNVATRRGGAVSGYRGGEWL